MYITALLLLLTVNIMFNRMHNDFNFGFNDSAIPKPNFAEVLSFGGHTYD